MHVARREATGPALMSAAVQRGTAESAGKRCQYRDMARCREVVDDSLGISDPKLNAGASEHIRRRFPGRMQEPARAQAPSHHAENNVFSGSAATARTCWAGAQSPEATCGRIHPTHLASLFRVTAQSSTGRCRSARRSEHKITNCSRKCVRKSSARDELCNGTTPATSWR
jgi:hypothetical protein